MVFRKLRPKKSRQYQHTTERFTALRKIIKEGSKEKLGLFTVNQVDAKYYFQIPDSLFNRYMLVVTRYLSTPEGMGVLAERKPMSRQFTLRKEQTILFFKVIAIQTRCP